jgi:hypothetical protein
MLSAVGDKAEALGLIGTSVGIPQYPTLQHAQAMKVSGMQVIWEQDKLEKRNSHSYQQQAKS